MSLPPPVFRVSGASPPPNPPADAAPWVGAVMVKLCDGTYSSAQVWRQGLGKVVSGDRWRCAPASGKMLMTEADDVVGPCPEAVAALASVCMGKAEAFAALPATRIDVSAGSTPMMAPAPPPNDLRARCSATAGSVVTASPDRDRSKVWRYTAARDIAAGDLIALDAQGNAVPLSEAVLVSSVAVRAGFPGTAIDRSTGKVFGYTAAEDISAGEMVALDGRGNAVPAIPKPPRSSQNFVNQAPPNHFNARSAMVPVEPVPAPRPPPAPCSLAELAASLRSAEAEFEGLPE